MFTLHTCVDVALQQLDAVHDLLHEVVLFVTGVPKLIRPTRSELCSTTLVRCWWLSS